LRILIANDGFGGAGGVQRYLESVVDGLLSRGHDIAMLYRDTVPDAVLPITMNGLPLFSVGRDGAETAFQAIRAWGPSICFSNNMCDLGIEERLLAIAPVVRFMHGYNGTCISGQKSFGLPTVTPCDRKFGAPCLALYLPRRCGEVSVSGLVHGYREGRAQQALFSRYRAIVVASEHMQREYVRNGADAYKVHVNPLFPTHEAHADDFPDEIAPSVVFLGRMTRLKGGGLLVRAVAEASRRIGTAIRLTMVGDGPQRHDWERLASRMQVACVFTGWQNGDDRWNWVRRASLLAVPSAWPEPFGLVGLEAAALGVPAIAFDVGGIREWLTPGENGYLVAADPPRASPFADGLVSAFRDPTGLRAMRARSVASARRLSLDRHLDRLEAIFGRSPSRTDPTAG
jgi:glycosyltransferase involved in cell wall biosynthesis